MENKQPELKMRAKLKKDLFPTKSPTVSTKSTQPLELSFPDAIREVLNLHKITRVEWNDSNTFGVLKDGFLCIFIRGEYHQWIVNDGDLNAIDWIVIQEGN